jgi:hypothetical protein
MADNQTVTQPQDSQNQPIQTKLDLVNHLQQTSAAMKQAGQDTSQLDQKIQQTLAKGKDYLSQPVSLDPQHQQALAQTSQFVNSPQLYTSNQQNNAMQNVQSPTGQFQSNMQTQQPPQSAQPAPQTQNPQTQGAPDYSDPNYIQKLVQSAVQAGNSLRPSPMQAAGNFIGAIGGNAPQYSPGQQIGMKVAEQAPMMARYQNSVVSYDQNGNPIFTPAPYGKVTQPNYRNTQLGQQDTQADINAKNAQAGIFPNQQSQSGQQTATGLPQAFDSMAQDVANYKLDMKSVLQRVPPAIKAQFIQGVSTLNPNYDQKTFQARQDYQNSLSSGTIGKNITALNTVIPHIDRLNQSLQALGNGNIPMLNGVKNWFSEVSGSGSPARAKTDLVATSNEIESVYRATGGTEEGIRAWRSGQPATSASPDQQKQWVQEGLGLIEGRLGAMGNDYQQNMGQPAPANRFMSPQNQQIMQRLGGQQQTQAPQNNSQSTIPQGATHYSPSTRRYYDANGNAL